MALEEKKTTENKTTTKKTTTKDTKKPSTKSLKTTAKKTTAGGEKTKKASSSKATTTKKATTKSSVKKPASKSSTAKKKIVENKDIKATVNEFKEELSSPIENDYNDKTKAYKILSYIGILWIIVLLVPEKNNKGLRFHVGQGIILSIFNILLYAVVQLINILFVNVLFAVRVNGLVQMTLFGTFLQFLINLAYLVIIIIYMVIGIKNALANKNSELPIIGKFSFYK